MRSANYLAKTLNALAKEGIVGSTRGPQGGFRLRIPPAQVTLAEVVETFDDVRPRALCLLGDRPCDERHPCRAHAAWTRVCADIPGHNSVRSVTLPSRRPRG